MSKKLYEESDVQAIADAIREKNGLTDTYTVSQMAAAISAIEAGGGGLPSGWATGTFQRTPANMTKEVSIEHGLGAVPRYVFVLAEVDHEGVTSQVITFAATFNGSSSCSYVLAYNSTSLNLIDCTSSKTADSATNIYLPTNGGSAWYFFTNTYRWIAIL